MDRPTNRFVRMGESPAGGASGGGQAGGWALVDQGVVSLGNFLTSLLLARFLPQETFGVYALLFGLMLAANQLHSAAVVYPLLLQGAVADRRAMRRLASVSLAYSLALAPLTGIALGVATILLNVPGTWLGAAVALTCWQAQETTRRILMAKLRHRAALWGDSLSYLGQALAVLCLGMRGSLALNAAFGIIAATSALAALVQVLQSGLGSCTVQDIAQHIKRTFGVGGGVLTGHIALAVSMQTFPWALGLSRGPSAAASYQAIANVLGLAHPIMFGVGNLMLPSVARINAIGGARRAMRGAIRQAGEGAILLTPVFAGILFWSSQILRAFYGPGSPYMGLTRELRVFVAVYIVMYIAQAATSTLNGLGRVREASISHVCGAGAAVALGIPASALLGLAGGIGGALASNVARLGMSLAYLRRAARAS